MLFDREDLYFQADGIKGDIHKENNHQKILLTIFKFPEEMPLILKQDYPFKFKIPENF
jgi:hypothetical protein